MLLGKVLAPVLVALLIGAGDKVGTYPHNAVSCERCHSVPTKFGGGQMTVQRMGVLFNGRFIAASEGGIHHRNGESAQSSASANQIIGERVWPTLLGDGYVEAIDSHDLEQSVRQQRQSNLGIGGAVVVSRWY
jgi:hypothetical protein